MNRILSIAVLLFIGIGAVYGGISLLLDPSGGLIKLPFDYLKDTPFKNYFIPGLILLVTLGISAIKIAILTILKWRFYFKLIILQGWVVLGWIVIQILLIKVFFWLQFVIGGMGIFLIISGMIMNAKKIKHETT